MRALRPYALGLTTKLKRAGKVASRTDSVNAKRITQHLDARIEEILAFDL
jgi:hypothetical protein